MAKDDILKAPDYDIKAPSGRLLFKKTAREHIGREGLESLLEAIQKTDFYESPASAKHHGAWEEGLVRHSLKVFDRMKRYADDVKVDMESVAIVALFHDLCKINNYEVSMKNVKGKDGKWTQEPYFAYKDDMFPVGHGEKSIMMITEFMKLKPEEMMAIRWHMGGFVPKEEYNTLSQAYKLCPLAMYLHFADMEATYVDGV